jgi:Secretion system C-terminal sorting domain
LPIKFKLMKKLLTLMLIFIGYLTQAQTTQDTIDKPYWQAMMSDRTVNFYKTKRAYDLYFSNKAKVRGTGWKQYERWADNASKIINRDGSFPPIDKVEKIMAQYNRNNLTPRSTSGVWVSVGPEKEPGLGKWAGGNMSGAGTGRLNVLAIHPTNSDIMYAGAPQGGLWKTTNAGVSWTQVPGMSNAQGISTIVLFADDANRIIVGTGDRDASDAPGRGIYVSTDGGTSFTQYSLSGLTSNGHTWKINKIIVNPVNTNVLIATSSSGILRSRDKGNTWTWSNLNESYLDIAYAPGDTTTVYMTGNQNSSESDNFYLSTDGGATFNTSMTGITVTGINRSMLATTPANPNIVYLIRVNQTPMEGFYKSSNKGVSWTKIKDVSAFNLMGYAVNGSTATDGQSFFNVAIYADNLDSNRVIVGGVNLYETTDGGANWTCRSHWSGENSLPRTHSDVHYITKNTNNNTFFICNDGGLYKTTNMTSFTPIYDGMVISQFYDIDVTRAENGKLVGGLQDNSMVERKAGSWLTHLGGDGMFAEVSDFDPNLMVGSSQNGGLEFTKDGFASASERIANNSGYGIVEAGPWVTPFQMSPFNDNIFAAAFMTKVFYTKTLRSLDPNNKDANLFKSLAISGEGTAVRFSAKDSNICFVGTKTGNFYRINNMANGTTPTITQLTSPDAGGFGIHDIETSSKDVNMLWAVLDTMVYQSTNGGTSWTNITGNLPGGLKKFSIIADKFSSFDRVYVGTESGVYVNSISSVSPTSWQQFSTSMPQYTHIRDLEIWYDTVCFSSSSIYAGTYGRGAWKSDLYKAEDVNYTINGSATPTVATNADYTISWATSLSTSSAKWSVTPSAGVTFANNNADSATGAITFANAGVYTIKVKAFNSHGGYCTKSRTVTVGTPPTITVKISSSSKDNKICVGDSVTLTANGGVSYAISPLANSTKINDSTFKVKPSSTTLYTIVGTGSNGQTDKDSLKITVNAITPVTVNPASATVVSGGTVNITASGGVSYNWSPSTYLTSTTKVATITSKPTSNITYTVEGTDAQGCKSTATAAVNVSAAPLSVQVMSTTTSSVCKGSKLVLKGSGATTYTLAPMTNVVKINDSMFEVSPMMNTNYYLTGTIGSNSGSDSIAITVNALPVINVSPSVSVGAAGSSRTLSASGAATYSWTPNAFVVSGANTATLTVAPTSTTLYTVEGTDAKGCKGSNTANINVQITPPLGLAAPNIKLIRNTAADTICMGENINFTVQRTLPSGTTGTTTKVTYSLSPMTNVTKVDDTTFEILPTTTTKYFLTGVDENSLVGLDSVTITVFTLPTVSVTPASAYVMLGNSATFTASGGGSYEWSPSTYVTSDTVSAALTFTPTNFINYEVEVTGTNGCSNNMEVPVGVYTLRTATASACKSYDWGGNTYTSSGSYSDTFEASTGIDSIVTLTLTIQNIPVIIPATTITSTTNPYSWRGKLLTVSGTYKDTVVSATACDSIFTLNLTIKPAPLLVPVSIGACDSLIWRGKVYRLSGTYSDTVLNATRDTIHQLTLSLGTINTTVSYANGVFTSNCIGCTYQWYVCHGIGFTAILNATTRTLVTNTSGDVRVEVKQGGCTGFSTCVNKLTLSIIANYGKEIIAYPNPVKNILYVSTEKAYAELNIVLVDVLGKVIMERTYQNTQDVEINAKDLTPGSYYIQVYNGKELKSTLKLTKE